MGLIASLAAVMLDPLNVLSVVCGCILYRRRGLSALAGAGVGCLISLVVLGMSSRHFSSDMKAELFFLHVVDGVLIALLASWITDKVRGRKKAADEASGPDGGDGK